jgi:hypothetical protein
MALVEVAGELLTPVLLLKHAVQVGGEAGQIGKALALELKGALAVSNRLVSSVRRRRLSGLARGIGPLPRPRDR